MWIADSKPTDIESNDLRNWMYSPSKDDAQTALFKDPVRTAL
jgi:hypothetical protein